MSRRGRRGGEEDSESYFVSLSDLMAGVLFLFIIMLTYFGLELRKTADAVSEHRVPVAKPAAAAAPKAPPAPPAAPPPPPIDMRTALLQRLKLLLLQAHSPADVDIAAGVVRLPNAVLFAGGSDQLSPGGQAALGGVADALAQVLPCAAYAPGLPPPAYCPSGHGRLAAVTLEGHAPVGADSLTRSAVQAAAAYRGLTAGHPQLAGLRSDPAGGGPPLISVSGYAAGAAAGATTSNAVEIRLYVNP